MDYGKIMRLGAPWGGRIGPDRILALSMLACALLGTALLYGHAMQTLADRRARLVQALEIRAVALDGVLSERLRQMETLSRRAALFLAQNPPPVAVAPGSPLDRFLESNPEEAADRLFSLDPSPRTIGTLLALPTVAARRRTGLYRPDPVAWHREAAMALTLAPLADAIRTSHPDTLRVYYASAAGLVHVDPGDTDGATALLDGFAAQEPFRRATPEANPLRRPFWTVLGDTGGGRLAAAVAPVDQDGLFLGIYAQEVPLPDPGAAPAPGTVLALLDRDGTVLAANAAPDRTAPAPGERLPGVADLPDGPGLSRSGDSLVAVQTLGTAPWRLVLILPVGGFRMAVLTETVLSLGTVLALLLGSLLLAYRLMERILREREQAAAAERAARAEAEKTLEELRAAHDELDFLNREKTRFFSLISHDLRGPFNALLGMTQELADHAGRMPAEAVADFARCTHESARKAFDMLENLLQWSRVQMSGKPFAPAVFDLRAVVTDAMGDVASMAAAKQVALLDAVGDRWVLADRTMVLAVLRNLLVNAVKFSHPAGVVHVTSRAEGDRVEVAVTDHGIGMERAQVAELLRAGSGGQGSRPGTRGEQGTGLGMTLVRELVLRHGGDLRVESEVGRGTTVSFTVPLAAPPEDRRRPGQTPP
ncbi:sensor histidine kinase [Rhodocista pekingensis]|uniref:histidine kinase n=1 Tax=Rhodocista pekingensis TaxID=201185 RepID=A0ABW2KRW9_9PROT